MSLKVEDCCDADVLHVSDVLVVNRIRPNENVLIPDLVDVEIFEEVGIGLLDASIDNPGIASQVSLVNSSVAKDRVSLKLTSVRLSLWLVNVEDSPWLSFSLVWSSWSFTSVEDVIVLDPSWFSRVVSRRVVEFNNSSIRHDLLAVFFVQPGGVVSYLSLHLNGASKLRSVALNYQRLIPVDNWVVNSEMHRVFFPNIVDLNNSSGVLASDEIGLLGGQVLEDADISDPRDASLFFYNIRIGGVALSQKISVVEEWSGGCEWRLRNPNVTIGPFEAVFQVLVVSKLIDVTNNPQVLPRFCLILDLKGDAVELFAQRVGSGVRTHERGIAAHQVESRWIALSTSWTLVLLS